MGEDEGGGECLLKRFKGCFTGRSLNKWWISNLFLSGGSGVSLAPLGKFVEWGSQL
jgi:hypothetical protein